MNIRSWNAIQTIILNGLLLASFKTTIGSTVTYLFSHGLADTHRQVFNYLRSPANPKKPYILDWPTITFDYPDATTGFLRLNRAKTSLAQENEIFRLSEVFNNNLTSWQPTVLMGVSRGASAIVTFMGLYNPPSVKALVLESPFDCVESIVRDITGRSCLSWIPGIHHCGHALVRLCFCKYRPTGFKPLDFIKNIPKKLPVLIVCWTKDPLVPVWASLNIYKAFRQEGNNDTYVLILSHGKHGKLILNKKNSTIYQDVVHAFYKHYNLPHNEEYAARGKPIFENCQPSFDKLSPYYPSYAHHPFGVHSPTGIVK